MSIEVGRIASGTWDVVRSRGGSLVGLWFVFLAMQFLWLFVGMLGLGASFAGLAGSMTDDSAFAGLGVGAILLMVLLYLAYLALYCAQSVAMSRQASPLMERNFGESIATGFKGALPMLGASIFLIVGYFAGAFLLGGVASVLGETASLIVTLLLLPLLVYLACRLCILPVVVAVDGIGNPITAILRTWKLTGGNISGIFLSMMAYLLFVIVVMGTAFAMFYLLVGGADGEGNVTGAAALLPMLAIMLAGVLVIVSGSALVAVIHSHLTAAGGEQLTETFE